MRAIALSLGGGSSAAAASLTSEAGTANTADKETPSSDILAEEDDLPEEEYEALSTKVIDDFAANALTGCLSLLDSLPDTVYRVCDLLLAVFNRNGSDFKETILKSLIGEVHQAVQRLSNQDLSNPESFVTGDLAAKVMIKTLLKSCFLLFFHIHC